MTLQELKKTLQQHGFIVYRSEPDGIHLAERVRDNLIMDASVCVAAGPPLLVRLWVRAQRSDFPSSAETEASMFARARRLGAAMLERGFVEVETDVARLSDPGGSSRTLDTWYQVAYEKQAADVPELLDLLHFVLTADKVAPR